MMTHPNLLRIVRSCAKWRSGRLLVATLFLLLVVGTSVSGNDQLGGGAPLIATSDTLLHVTITLYGPLQAAASWTVPIPAAVRRRIQSVWIEPFGQYDVVCLFAKLTDSTVVPLALAPPRPELPVPTMPVCGTVVRVRAQAGQ